jgi:hypothetical protein
MGFRTHWKARPCHGARVNRTGLNDRLKSAVDRSSTLRPQLRKLVGGKRLGVLVGL